MRLINAAEIAKALSQINLMYMVEEGFAAQARGDANALPSQTLNLNSHAQVRLGSGYLYQDAYYLVRVDAAFAAQETPNAGSMSLLFDQRTGEALAALQDNGALKVACLAASSAVAAKYLAPQPERIGLLGTGETARQALLYLQNVTDCRDVLLWGDEDASDALRLSLSFEGFVVKKALAPREIAETCQLIISATDSLEPLLFAQDIQAGTHITALGGDAKQLEPELLRKAGRLVVEDAEESKLRGETFHALRAGCIAQDSMSELAQIIAGTRQGRSSPEQITIADLTGSTVQDIQIAGAVFEQIMGL